MLRVGIIGSGFGASVHKPAWEHLDNVVVSAMTAGATEELSGPRTDIEFHSDWKAIIARPDLDIIDVAVPPHAHREVVIAALQTGRHVMCEKPFGTSLADASAMSHAYAMTLPRFPSQRVAINYQFRFEEIFQELKEIISTDTIGDILRINVSWMTDGWANPQRNWSFQNDQHSGGGVILSFMSHTIDYIQWLSAQALTVTGGARTITHPQRPDKNGTLRSVTAEDTADLIGILDNGANVNCAISTVTPLSGSHTLEIFGTKGLVKASLSKPYTRGTVKVTTSTAVRNYGVGTRLANATVDSRIHAVKENYRCFCSLIEGEDENTCPSIGDAVNVHRAISKWVTVSYPKTLNTFESEQNFR